MSCVPLSTRPECRSSSCLFSRSPPKTRTRTLLRRSSSATSSSSSGPWCGQWETSLCRKLSRNGNGVASGKRRRPLQRHRSAHASKEGAERGADEAGESRCADCGKRRPVENSTDYVQWCVPWQTSPCRCSGKRRITVIYRSPRHFAVWRGLFTKRQRRRTVSNFLDHIFQYAFQTGEKSWGAGRKTYLIFNGSVEKRDTIAAKMDGLALRAKLPVPQFRSRQ